VISVAGPRAREVVAAAGTDIDLAPDSFPHMTFREGSVAGVQGRVARVSFSGEATYEINVQWSSGREMWETVIAAGEPLGLQPYGTQTMHVLRAEKGYPIIGQETDGSMTPADLGLGWLLKKDGDFVGKRALQRKDLVRTGRKQLVGLLPEDPEALLPEGAQLAWEDSGVRPLPMCGFVSSSYRSSTLGRTFALAMVADGREAHGRRIVAPLHGIWSRVADPVFYDKEGERLRG